MITGQIGIFALGTGSSVYLELDLRAGSTPLQLVQALASIREPRTTVGGVNLVSGFRPELWRGLAPNDIPADVTGFNDAITGPDGFTLPATQHDAVLWLAGSEYDVLFDEARSAIHALAGVATVANEMSGWPYDRYRDLTGFIDGTENPSLLEAPEVVLIPPGTPGAGGTILLLQKWPHDSAAWEVLSVKAQEDVIGRTKPDSIELDPRPHDSHVARTDQDTFGNVFRRNMPFGTVSEHGTIFVGFCAKQEPLATMLESMVGRDGGVRDALTRYTHAATGAYYFIPAAQTLAQYAQDDAGQ
ncbi:MAG: Dyp-type peroxidase [Thermomicrobiales bacterium]|nr:Dyp-type peroxidase [Thermomicrobiales bacterium]